MPASFALIVAVDHGHRQPWSQLMRCQFAPINVHMGEQQLVAIRGSTMRESASGCTHWFDRSLLGELQKREAEVLIGVPAHAHVHDRPALIEERGQHLLGDLHRCLAGLWAKHGGRVAFCRHHLRWNSSLLSLSSQQCTHEHVGLLSIALSAIAGVLAASMADYCKVHIARLWRADRCQAALVSVPHASYCCRIRARHARSSRRRRCKWS